MSRAGYDNKSAVHMPVPHHPTFHGASLHGATLHGGTLHEAKDERGSMSDSEDGSCGPYHDIGKGEYEIEDDHTALTSQTLNNDGTPKRPMNAFMIFARRRRPQVSAENQAMRTGEISKILSKEWNNMGAAEKQFYQDQARQLKDTFNMKYPDYVYRRRPNNSRRRRKPDTPGLRGSENQPPIDSKEDPGFEDVGESPTDGDELLTPDGMHDIPGSRMGQDLRLFSDHRQQPTRASSYVYPVQEHPSRSNPMHQENRLAYEPQSGGGSRTLQDTPGHALHYSYMDQGRIQNHSVPMYNQNAIGGNGNWGQPNLRQSWTGSADPAERGFTGLHSPKVHHRTSTSPSTNWQRPNHSPVNVSVGSPSLTLSTLSSPFYPVGSPQETASPPSSHPQSISSAPFNSNHMQPSLMLGRDYETPELPLSPSLSSPNQHYSPSMGRDAMMYSTRQATEPRGLPAISNYSQAQSSFAANSGLSGPQGYWTRD